MSTCRSLRERAMKLQKLQESLNSAMADRPPHRTSERSESIESVRRGASVTQTPLSSPETRTTRRTD
ncbi:MAG: hypothetical protein ACLR5S_04915 [Ruminococcus sp.]